MEFRDYAAKETSALLTRVLTGQNEAALQQIRALRQALDAASHTIETAAGGTPQLEKELQELIRRLTNAAATAARASAQKVQDEARALLDVAHSELESQRARTEELEISLASAQAQSESLQVELQAERIRIDHLTADLDLARDAFDQLETAREETEIARREQADARAALEDELRETRGLLDAALSEADTLTTRVETEASENTRLIAEISVLRTDVHGLEAERDNFVMDRSALAAERDTLVAERDNAAAERDVTAAERDAIAAERNLVAAERDAAAAERNLMAAERDVMAAERDAAAARADATHSRILSLERTQAELDVTIHDLEARLASHADSDSQLREQSSQAGPELEQARGAATTLREEVQRLQSLFDASVHAADELSHAGSISELLSTLVRQLSAHFSRVALFRLKGNHLEGEHQIGFDLKSDITKLVIPLNVDSLITRAADSRSVETLKGEELADSRLAPFGTQAAAALAIPVVLDGDAMAVVYAEEPESDSSAAVQESHVGFAKLVVRHAAALLVRLSRELQALSELREYAQLLLKEAEEMHTADAEGGRDEDELQRRLKDNIDCARQLFLQRASAEGASASSLLEEQIAAAAAVDSRFARDLGAVAGHTFGGVDRGRAAEAS